MNNNSDKDVRFYELLEQLVTAMTDYEKGLSEQEVRKRLENGQYNKADNFETKSFLQILKDNVCTLFNAMNLFLAIAVISVGSYKNIMFMMSFTSRRM